MTVEELIEKLEEMPLDAKVTADGCQACVHVVVGAEVSDASTFPGFWKSWIGNSTKIVNLVINTQLP